MLVSPALRVMQIDAVCFCEIKPSNSGLGRPLGLQEVEPPRISRQHMKLVRLSALCTGCLYPLRR